MEAILFFLSQIAENIPLGTEHEKYNKAVIINTNGTRSGCEYFMVLEI